MTDCLGGRNAKRCVNLTAIPSHHLRLQLGAASEPDAARGLVPSRECIHLRELRAKLHGQSMP